MYTVAHLMKEQSRYHESIKKQTAIYSFRLVHTPQTYCLFHFIWRIRKKRPHKQVLSTPCLLVRM